MQICKRMLPAACCLASHRLHGAGPAACGADQVHHAQEHDLPAAQALRHRRRASNHPHARQRAHDCMLSTTKYAECPLSTSERTHCRRRPSDAPPRCRRVAVSIFGFHPSSLSVECVPSQCSHGYSTSAIVRSSCTAQPFRIDPARLLQAANLVGCAVTFSQSIRSVSAPPQSPSLTSAPDRRGPYSSPAARLWPLWSVRWQPPGPF